MYQYTQFDFNNVIDMEIKKGYCFEYYGMMMMQRPRGLKAMGSMESDSE